MSCKCRKCRDKPAPHREARPARRRVRAAEVVVADDCGCGCDCSSCGGGRCCDVVVYAPVCPPRFVCYPPVVCAPIPYCPPLFSPFFNPFGW